MKKMIFLFLIILASCENNYSIQQTADSVDFLATSISILEQEWSWFVDIADRVQDVVNSSSIEDWDLILSAIAGLEYRVEELAINIYNEHLANPIPNNVSIDELINHEIFGTFIEEQRELFQKSFHLRTIEIPSYVFQSGDFDLITCGGIALLSTELELIGDCEPVLKIRYLLEIIEVQLGRIWPVTQTAG